MTYNQIRLVKRVLAILLVCFAAVVAYQLHLSLGQKRGAGRSLPLPEPADPVARQIELTRLDSEGEKAFVLRAAESMGDSEGSQLFRDVEIEFAAGRQRIPLTITAEDCRYDATAGTVHLEGNVVVRDSESLRIETEVLDYGQDRVTTDEPLRFSREGATGAAVGLMYEIPAGLIELHDQVAMTFEKDGRPPLEVKSRHARMLRHRGRVRFVDDVVVHQENRWLYCNDLQVYLTDDESRIEHIEAYEQVELHMRVPPPPGASNEPPPGIDDDPDRDPQRLFREPGQKTLLTQKLEAFLHPDSGVVERVRALDGGVIVLEPHERTASSGIRRELEGNLLAFDFDDQGRLTELRGRGGVELRLLPLDPSRGPEKRLAARQLEADFDPQSGELREARCLRSVEFSQGDLRATAERGVYRSAAEKVVLTENPRLRDPDTTLEAERIEIEAESGALEATRNVRSSLRGGSPRARSDLFPGGGEEPVHFIADHLAYAEDVAVYTGSARGFQGTHRVEGDRIELRERTGELIATGSVRTVMVPMGSDDEEADSTRVRSAAPSEPTVTLAEELYYRAEEGILHYRGGVRMSSETMVVRSEQLDVSLDADRERVEEAYARGAVELSTQQGKAGGLEAKYLPKKEEIWISGDKAWMQDGDKLTEGKELTFFLSNDRIFVDGREQDRTKTIYTSKSRPF